MESIIKIIRAIIKDATNTTTALFCSSSHVGHETLFNNSSNEFLMYDPIFI